MNRDSIIGAIVIAALFIGYSFYISPSKEEIAEQKRVADSIALVQKNKREALLKEKALEEKRRKETVVSPEVVTDTNTNTNTTGQFDQLVEKFGYFAKAKMGEQEYYDVETDLYKLKFSNKGGRIYSVELKDYLTYDSLPLILFDSDTSAFGLSFFSKNRNINTKDFYFKAFLNGKEWNDQRSLNISGDQKQQIGLRLYPSRDNSSFAQNSYIEYLYTISGDNYMMDVDVNFVNFGDFVEAGTPVINLEWKENLRTQDRNVARGNGYGLFFKYYKDDVDEIANNKDESTDLTTKVKWVSFKQHFFSSTLIAKDAFLDGRVESKAYPSPISRSLSNYNGCKLRYPF